MTNLTAALFLSGIHPWHARPIAPEAKCASLTTKPPLIGIRRDIFQLPTQPKSSKANAISCSHRVNSLRSGCKGSDTDGEGSLLHERRRCGYRVVRRTIAAKRGEFLELR